MNGILLIDKPAGWTSHDIVAKIRGLAKKEAGQKIKVGHAGTLDPFATGLLIILLGSYTKRAEEFLKLDKTYDVTVKLGEVSSTGDPEGEISAVSNLKPEAQEMENALNGFIGEIEQTPPAYSAIKVDGKRAYKLAREGKQVELQPRKVHIYSIENAHYEYPELSFTVKVSSGTYIRTLAEDIGKALGTGAYTSALHRTRIDMYDIAEAYKIGDAPKGLSKLI